MGQETELGLPGEGGEAQAAEKRMIYVAESMLMGFTEDPEHGADLEEIVASTSEDEGTKRQSLQHLKNEQLIQPGGHGDNWILTDKGKDVLIDRSERRHEKMIEETREGFTKAGKHFYEEDERERLSELHQEFRKKLGR